MPSCKDKKRSDSLKISGITPSTRHKGYCVRLCTKRIKHFTWLRHGRLPIGTRLTVIITFAVLETDDIQKAINRETIERLSREVEHLRLLLEFQMLKAAVPKDPQPQLSTHDPHLPCG